MVCKLCTVIICTVSWRNKNVTLKQIVSDNFVPKIGKFAFYVPPGLAPLESTPLFCVLSILPSRLHLLLRHREGWGEEPSARTGRERELRPAQR